MKNDKDIFSKLVEKAKTNSMTEREQRTLFLAVDTYVENNPIYIKENATHGAEKTTDSAHQAAGIPASRPSQRLIPSPFMSDFSDRFQSFVSSWHIHSFKTVVAVFVIMIFGVGGSSLAAKNSLPGNFLYPVKVNINEGIKTAILSGPARTTYEVERVKMRIEEAKQLVAQDKLTPKAQEQITTRLASHVETVQKDINTLAKKGNLKVAFEISNDLEHSLEETQASVAAELSGEDVSDQKIASIAEILNAPLEISTVVRETTEDQIATLQANDETTKVIALAKLDSVKRIMEKIDGSVIADATLSTGPADATPSTMMLKTAVSPAAIAPVAATTSNPTDKFSEVRILIQQGEEKLVVEEYDEAFSLFKQATELAEKIQLQIEIDETEETESRLETTDQKSVEPISPKKPL